MDIKSVSEATIAQLYDVLGVREAYDLYSLTKEQLSRLDGFKDKKIQGFLQSVEQSKNVSLANFINALGIENVGKVAAKELADKYKSIDALMNATEEQLMTGDLIGEVTAKSIVEYFARRGYVVRKLLACGINPVCEKSDDQGIFSGKKFVLTGTLQKYTRSQASEIIEKNGGTVQSAVTKSTDYVIAGENAGRKIAKSAKTIHKNIIGRTVYFAYKRLKFS